MSTIEFFTTIEDDTISIPPEHRSKLGKRVKVILLTEDVPGSVQGPSGNMIDALLERPIRRKGFRPLTREEVYARS